MDEFKGTQGEWRVVQLDGSDKRHYREGFDTAVETDETSIACMDSDNPHDATLIAAAPDLLRSQTMGQSLNTPDFLDWVADRLVNEYGVSSNMDFVWSLRERAATGRAAIAKALGESS